MDIDTGYCVSISTIPPGRIKRERHLFLLRVHAVDRQLFCLTGGGDGVVQKFTAREKEKGNGK